MRTNNDYEKFFYTYLNKWEITIDNYEYIFVHEFNLSDNKIEVTKVYKRIYDSFVTNKL